MTLAFLASLVAGAVGGAQVGDPREIRGRVVAAGNGAALPRVRVTGDAGVAPAFTDDRGRFVLSVPSSAGRAVRLQVGKAGFATVSFDATREAASGRELVIALARGAALAGRVVNVGGGPMVSSVVIVRPVPPAGAPSASGPAPVAVLTDDLGEYRVGGLPEGRYAVQVADEPAVSAADMSTTLETGIGSTAKRDRLSELNERLRNEPANLSAERPPATVVSVRPGDEARLPDLMAMLDEGPLCRRARDTYAGDDPSATASIIGRVLDSSGARVSCANVALVPASGVRSVVGTDANGRFAYTNLPAGSYSLEAFKPSYTGRWFGQDRSHPSGTPIALEAGESLDLVDIALPRRPAITGTVIDDHGEPMAGIAVRALQLRTTGDLTMAVNAPGVGVRATDDRGRYRLFGLAPGRYLIRASIDAAITGDGGAYGYAPIYYPGTFDVATASVVEVGSEGDFTGVDLSLLRTRTYRISGLAFDASGGAAREIVIFPSQRSSGIVLEPRRVPVAPDGAFSVSNVPPGEYVVQVFVEPAGRDDRGDRLPPRFGMQYVTVADRDPPPLVVRTSGGSTVEGRMVVRGGGVLPYGDLWTIPTDYDRSPIGGGGLAGLSVYDDGWFRFAGLTGARRFVLQSTPDGWYLESITLNGRDIMNTPFDFGVDGRRHTGVEAVLSDAAAAVAGRVTDGRGQPVRGDAVIVFSTDRSHWFRYSPRLAVTWSDPQGTFRIGSLPPGEYFVAATSGLMSTFRRDAEWQDPARLDALARRAERIALDERERAAIEIRR